MDEKDIQALVAALAPVIKGHVETALKAQDARIKTLEDRAPLQGEQGPSGKDGADGPSIEDVKGFVEQQVLATVAKIPPPVDGKDGKSADEEAIAARIMDVVMAKVAAIPVPKDGADGQNGKDGVGLADALIDREGALVVTLTNGTAKNLGLVVGKHGQDGAAGNDGSDGLGFEDIAIEFDGERGVKFFGARGETRKELGAITLPVIIDRGVYKEGQSYQRGDATSWGGSLWVAQEDTTDKPETSKAWRLAVKRGRDGKDGVMKVAKPPETVKLP